MSVPFTPAGTLPIATLPAGLGLGTHSPFAGLSDDDELVWLVRLFPFDETETRSFSGPPVPLGVAPIAAPRFRQRGQAVTLRLSQGGHVTAANDPDLANTPYRDAVEAALNLAQRLPSGDGGGLFGGGQGSDGEITIGRWRELAAATGASLSGLTWANRRVEVLVGRKDFTHEQFGVMLRGRLGDASWSHKAMTLRLRDPKDRLAVPLSLPIFAGTGGYEGPAELTGQHRPCTLGVKRNVAGEMINRPLKIVQFNFRAIQAFLGLRVRGDDVTPSGDDYATYDELAAATVASGHYSTCLALGLARLGTDPDGDVKADLQGDAPGGVYVETVAEIVRRLATLLLPGNARLADPSEIDGTAFARATLQEPGAAGLHIASGPGAPTGREAIDGLIKGVGGWWDISAEGKLFLVLLGVPSRPVRTIPAAEIDLDAGGVRVLEGAPAAKSVQVGYREMVEPDRLEDLAAGIGDDLKDLLTQRWRYPPATVSNRARVRHADAQDLVIDSPFDTADAALRMQARLGPWLATRPRSWQVPLTRGRFYYKPGQAVRLEDPLTGLEAAPIMWVSALERDSLGTPAILRLLGSTETPYVPGLGAEPQSGLLTFLGDPDDGRIFSYDPTYADARAGTGDFLFVSSTVTSGTVGQQFGVFFPPDFGVAHYGFLLSYLQFNTATLDGATVDSFDLSLRFLSVDDAPGDTIEVRSLDWSPPLQAGGFVAGADIGALPLVASIAMDGSALPHERVSLTNEPGAETHINTTGVTRFIVCTSPQRLGTTPTGSIDAGFYLGDVAQVALRPTLEVSFS